MNIQKRVAKFEQYLKLDKQILSRAKNLTFSTNQDITWYNSKYIDTNISLLEYESFIGGLLDIFEYEGSIIFRELGIKLRNESSKALK